jgi:hypothetical protein
MAFCTGLYGRFYQELLIAIIMPEEDVPQIWRDMVERTYPKAAVPFWKQKQLGQVKQKE